MNWQRFIEAYNKTPLLWNGVLPSYFFENFSSSLRSNSDFQPISIRLGNICEELFFNQLKQSEKYDLIAKNIQVTSPTKTLGEIDCIVSTKDLIVHIEHTYKFYLGIKSNNEILQWIGPNKKDSLYQKLNKIKTRQFPLLYQKETVSLLKRKFNLDAEAIIQRTLFKSQLFIPKKEHVFFDSLNKNCISGYYYFSKDLPSFSECLFVIPDKSAWPLSPDPQDIWIEYELAKEIILAHFEQHKSPMVWMQYPNGILEKCFFVWWT